MGFGRPKTLDAEVIYRHQLVDTKTNETPYYCPLVDTDGKYEKDRKVGKEREHYSNITGKIQNIKIRENEHEGKKIYNFDIALLDDTNGKSEGYILHHTFNSLSRRILNFLYSAKDLSKGDTLTISVQKDKEPYREGKYGTSVFVQLNGKWLKSGIDYDEVQGYITEDIIDGQSVRNFKKLDKEFYVGKILPEIIERLSVPGSSYVDHPQKELYQDSDPFASKTEEDDLLF